MAFDLTQLTPSALPATGFLFGATAQNAPSPSVFSFTATGTGNLVLATNPALTTPNLGTPSAATLTNCTGLPIAGITGLGTGVATALGTAVTGSGGIVLATGASLTTPALSGATVSTTATVTAGTNAQGQGALTSDLNIITTNASNPGGVTLPTATTGRTVAVVNATANPVNVYPASGAVIDYGSANAAISLPSDTLLVFRGASATAWYSTSLNASSLAAATGTLAIGHGGTGLTALGTGVQTALGNAVTGSGGIVLATSPALTTPNIGTPSAGTLTNCTGLPIAGISGLGTGVATALAAAVTGSGGIVLATSPALTTPNIGTPSAGTLTNCTGLPIAGITGLGTGVGTALANATNGAGGLLTTDGTATLTNKTFDTAGAGNVLKVAGTQLSAVTGTGSVVLATSPTLTTPTIGAATATTVNKVTITAPATGSTLTIADGQTLTVNKSTTLSGGTLREALTAARTYYVCRNLTNAPAISNSGGNVLVTSNSHGCANGDQVSFAVPQNLTAATSISQANPVVVTMTNTFAAGQPVTFSATETLPIPLVAGTTYYVISTGLSGSSFQVSTTVGGAAVNTTAVAATFTSSSANIAITNASTYFKVGQIVRFAGTSITNISNNTQYYVTSATATNIQVASTLGGSAITVGTVTTSGTVAASGTYYVRMAGALPSGMGDGTEYYVINATTNTFQISTTNGGSAVTYGTAPTGSPVYNCRTGNDANSGLTTGAPVFSMGKALAYIYSIDMAGYNTTIQLADGTYCAGTYQTISMSSIIGGTIIIQGNTSSPANVFVNGSGATDPWGSLSFTGNGPVAQVQYLRIGGSKNAIMATQGSSVVVSNTIYWDSVTRAHLSCNGGSIVKNYDGVIVGGAGEHIYIAGTFSPWMGPNSNLVTLDTPPFGAFIYATTNGALITGAYPAGASVSGPRYAIDTGGAIQTFGGGAAALPGTSAGTGGTTTGGGNYA